MKNVKFTYPGYVMKAYTMSYDDGSIQDKKIIALWKKYGIKGTFFLNTRFNGSQGYMNHLGYTVWCQRPFDSEIADIYRGFEIGNHTVSHPMIAEIPYEEQKREVMECSEKLEGLTGIPVNGMGYPGNSFNPELEKRLKEEWHIEYGRLASSSHKYNLPENFHEWEPCSHDAEDCIPDLARGYVALKPDEMTCFYVWGHSYELDKPGSKLWDDVDDIHDRWANFEKFMSVIGGHSDIWYGTNLEICRYVNAVRSAKVTENGVENTSDLDIYAIIDGKETVIPAHSKI